MTRREQIEEAAKQLPRIKREAFNKGAEWADSTNIVTEINLNIQKENSELKRILSQTQQALDVAVEALEYIVKHIGVAKQDSSGGPDKMDLCMDRNDRIFRAHEALAQIKKLVKE